MMRGGMGGDQLVEFPYNDGEVSCIGNRERFGPPGIFGGEAGGLARLVLNPDEESKGEFRNIGIFAVNEPAKRGDLMSFWAAGGGGYGDPFERDPERVLSDVIDEYISVEAARRDYGVAVDVVDARRLDYRIDWEATNALRANRAGAGA